MDSQLFDLRAAQIGPDETLSRSQLPDLAQILTLYTAAYVRGFFSLARCVDLAARISSRRSSWSKDYDGEQFSLPDNFYARANCGDKDRYFDKSAAANAEMASSFPNEYRDLFNFIERLWPSKRVGIRPGWLGPAFVIFPAAELLSREPGPVHIDLEGLAESGTDIATATCFSIICMIQPPEVGGGVRLWGSRAKSALDEEATVSEASKHPKRAIEFKYEAGDVLIINSMAPHQILQYGGNRDRITFNAFGAAYADSCDVWF